MTADLSADDHSAVHGLLPDVYNDVAMSSAGMLTRPSAYVLAMQCSKQPPRTVQPSAWRHFSRFASQWTYR